MSVCLVDPGFAVDAVVTCATPTLARVFSGERSWNDAVRAGDIGVTGPRAIVRTLSRWFLWSPWAKDVRAIKAATSTQCANPRSGTQSASRSRRPGASDLEDDGS